MRLPSRKVLVFRSVLVLLLSPLVVASVAQQPSDSIGVVQVIGFAGIKPKAKGNLKIENGKLQFSAAKTKADVDITSLEDVITGNDSQRVFRGAIGTLTMFAPYGGGRFLSLFRTKLDTLTIQYRDGGGALHGAIFTMAVGKADPLKKLLVAQGAHTSIPVQEDSGASNPKADGSKEMKP
jgi:hypothetical protein